MHIFESNIIPIVVSLVFIALYIYQRMENKIFKERVISRENRLSRLVESSYGGIYKRIDELREDVEIISQKYPEFFGKYVFVYEHLKSCDGFLNDIARIHGFMVEWRLKDVEIRPFPTLRDSESAPPAGVINERWHDHAYPLKQIKIIAQGSKHRNKEDLIVQLELAIARIKKGDVEGYEHDDDYGYSFGVNEEMQHSQFNGPAGLK